MVVTGKNYRARYVTVGDALGKFVQQQGSGNGISVEDSCFGSYDEFILVSLSDPMQVIFILQGHLMRSLFQQLHNGIFGNFISLSEIL
jgi:hypothetical protein